MPVSMQGGVQGSMPGMTGDMYTSNGRVPPYWGPELEATYPYRHWEKDLSLWSMSTDVEVHRQGPMVATRLGGVARAMAHEMPEQLLQNGNTEGLTGLQVLLRGLRKRFAPFTAETSARAMMEYLQFQRVNTERVDEAIARWGLLKLRATDQGGLQMSAPGRALLLCLA